MKLKGISIVYLIIMAFMLFVIILSLGMTRLSSKLLPLMVSGYVFITAGYLLFASLRGKRAPKAIGGEPGPDEKRDQKSNWPGHLIGLAWSLSFVLGIYLVGFLIAIPAVVFAYLRMNRTGWVTTILLTVLTLLFSWGVFEAALGVELYRGLLFMR